MRHRFKVAAAAAAISVGAAGVGLVPASPASAHHPVLAGATPCRVDSWTVTWTARADEVRGLTWRLLSPAGYAPSGPQPDSAAFTRTVTYPAGQASATETVSASWSNQVTGSASATVARPPVCPVDSTTTTEPEETTSTSTAPTTTSTLPPSTSVSATTVPTPTSTSLPTESTAPSTITSSVVSTTSTPAVSTPSGSLPATGPSAAWQAFRAAVVVLVLGAAMVFLTRRRRLS